MLFESNPPQKKGFNVLKGTKKKNRKYNHHIILYNVKTEKCGRKDDLT